MTTHGIDYLRDGRVARITLNRPEKLNALPHEAARYLGEIWTEIRDDPTIWVAVVTGTGERAFCAGIDVGETTARNETAEGLAAARREPLLVVGPYFYDCFKPVITAVNGLCAGIGLDFVTEADIVIAAEHATFFDPHVSVGLVSAHEMVELSRRVPLGIALRMNALGRTDRMTAARAYDIGLISEVVSKERLAARTEELIAQVLENAPLAVQLGKELILRGLHLSIRDATHQAERIRQLNIGTEDYLEGPKAFMEKRKPVWKGR
jgi:enoyl-CoA hydratase/carnithine racemase